MKFIHVSDTHLGCKTPIEYDEIREKDFLNAFKQVIDFAIEKKVDFVIHSGDLFDEMFRLSGDLLLEVVKELARLKANGIYFIAVKGNHDIKRSRLKAFEILKHSGLIYEVDRNPFVLDNVYINGISEPKDLGDEKLRVFYKAIFKKIKPDNDKFSIFISHTVPKELFDYSDPRVISITDLPTGFDYYAFGHFHIKQEPLEKEGSLYVLPGSTERTEISKREENSEKGFYFYNNGKLNFVKIKIRKIKVYENVIFEKEEIDRLIEKIINTGKETLIKVKILTTEEFKDFIRKAIGDLKTIGYLILYEEYISRRKDINVSEMRKINIESFDSLVESLIKEELNRYFKGNTREVEDLVSKILDIYETFGAEKLREWLNSRIKKPYVETTKALRQRTLLDLW